MDKLRHIGKETPRFLKTYKGILIMFVAFVVLLAIAFVPIIGIFTDKEQVIGKLALALAEILAAILVGAVLIQYLREYFKRSHRFVLGNIVNEAELTSSEKVPSSWSNLLRERLVREVERVQATLQSNIQPTETGQKAPKLRPFELSPYDLRQRIEAAYPLEDEKCLVTLSRCLPTPEPSPKFSYHSIPQDIVNKVSQLNVQFEVKQREDPVALLAGSVPAQVAPVVAVLGAIFPAPVIRINGYLQCCGNPPKRVGLTCEFVDQSTAKRSRPPETIWMETGETCLSSPILPRLLPQERSRAKWAPSTIATLCEQSFSAVISFPTPTPPQSDHASREGRLRDSAETGAEQPSQQTMSLTQHYIQLLAPAVRWLALELLEQWLNDQAAKEEKQSQTTSNRSTQDESHNGFPDEFADEPNFKEVVRFLFGALYHASAADYPACRDFFWRKAAEHFTAIEMNSHWWLPYRALGSILDDKLRQMGSLAAKRSAADNSQRVTPDEVAQMRMRLSDLRDTAVIVHEAALRVAKSPRRTDGHVEEKEIQARILVSKATALLHYGDSESLDEAGKILREDLEKNHFDYMGTPDDSAVLLNNLACWYAVLVDEMDVGWIKLTDAERTEAVNEAVNEGRFYMTACLLRDTDRARRLVDEETDLRSICSLDDLKKLKDLVKSTLKNEPNLATSKNETLMRQAVTEILRHVNWQRNPSIPSAQADMSGRGDQRLSQAKRDFTAF